jgi:hypothetical protein
MAFVGQLRAVLAGSGCHLHANTMTRGNWAWFSEPSGLCWKTDHGRLDLTAGPGWDVDSLREHLAAFPPPISTEAAQTGKSVVVRAKIAAVDVYAGFDETVGAEVARLAAALRRWVTDDEHGRKVVARHPGPVAVEVSPAATAVGLAAAEAGPAAVEADAGDLA